MIKKLLTVLIVVAGACAQAGVYGQEAPGQSLLKNIEISGNKRIPTDTIRFYLRSQVNRPVDRSTVERDFRSLVKLGPFENVTVEERDGQDGTILHFKVEERPFISSVDFEGVHPPMVARINDLLQAKKTHLRVNAPYDPEKGRQVERLIRELMEQEGYASPIIRVVAEPLNPATVKLTVKIHKGIRTKIESIAFEGNTAFDDTELRSHMRLVKQKSLVTLFTRKDFFSRARVEEDLQRITQHYQEHGYARVQVGKPRIEVIQGSLKAITTPKDFAKAKRLRIIIPIKEGPIYRIEAVARTGKSTAYEEEIRPLMEEIKADDLYNAKQLQDTYNDIKKALSRHGYMVLNPAIDQNFNDEAKTAKITFHLTDVYPIYVRKIEFEGNRRIPDKMLRRGLAFSEGDPFNEALLDRSLVKINRTGLVEDLSRMQVDLKVDKEEREVDVIVHLKERQRQGLWFTGGSAGLGGGYTGAIYSAVNMLGLGEILGLQLTGGKSNSNMVFDMITHNLFGSKFTLGFSLFRRFIEFPVLGTQNMPAGIISRVTQGRLGGALTGSYPLTEVSKVDLSLQSERITGNQPIPGIASTKGLSRRSMMPAFSFDTTDHLLDPTRGQKLVLGSAFSGGFLGGGISTMRPTMEYKIFRPDPLSGHRNTLAVRGLVSHVRGFDGSSVPIYDRFFSDGYILRGFDIGQASPLVYYPNGSTYGVSAIGGDMLTALSMEYRIPISGPVSIDYFFDAGLTSIVRDAKGLIAGQDLRLIKTTNSLLRISTGGELKVRMPMINQPIRFVFAVNPLRLRQSFIAPDGSIFRLKEPRSRTRLAFGNSF